MRRYGSIIALPKNFTSRISSHRPNFFRIEFVGVAVLTRVAKIGCELPLLIKISPLMLDCFLCYRDLWFNFH